MHYVYALLFLNALCLCIMLFLNALCLCIMLFLNALCLCIMHYVFWCISPVSLRCWPRRPTGFLLRRWGTCTVMLDGCRGYSDSATDCVVFRWSRCSARSLQMLQGTWTTTIWSTLSLTERRRTRNSSLAPQPITALPVCLFPPTCLWLTGLKQM